LLVTPEHEVVGYPRREHPCAGATVGLLLALLVRFDERPDGNKGQKDHSHGLDVDILDATEEAVAPFVDDEADQQAEDDFGRHREREEVVDTGDDQEVLGLVDRRRRRRITEDRQRLHEQQEEHPGHDDEGDADADVAVRPPEPLGAGELRE